MKLMHTNLEKWHTSALYRYRTISANDNISFNSSDYLGLSHHPNVIQATVEALRSTGVNSGGSPLVNGYHHAHERFEDAFANFVGFERAIYFNSGYAANLAIYQAITQKQQHIYYDQLSHASIIDGLKLSPAKRHRYPHLKLQSLHHALKECMITTNTVFSCDGNLAKLDELAAFDCPLIVDDAHGLGVLGKQGSGTLNSLNLQSKVLLANFPLSKGFGCYGAMVCGNNDIIERILQFARTYRYSTAIPTHFAHAGLEIINILKTEPQHLDNLRRNIDAYNRLAQQHQLPVSPTAIQSIPITNAITALKIQKQLQLQGFDVGCLRPPSAPHQTSLIRLTLNAYHTPLQLSQLIEQLIKLLKDAPE